MFRASVFCKRGTHVRGRTLGPPQDQPWGLRDDDVLDLEDRQWNFSERIREVVPEDWGADRVG